MGGCCDREIKYAGPLRKKRDNENQLDHKRKYFEDDPEKKSENFDENLTHKDGSAQSLDSSKKICLIKFVNLCIKQKKYSELVKLVTNTTEVVDPKAYIPWAEKPKTIGALVIVYLCYICSKDPVVMTPLITPMIPQFVSYLADGSEDLRDATLMLFYNYLDNAPEEAVVTLLELDIFSVLVRFLMCSKEELRHLTSGVCWKLYRGRMYAKKIFVDMNGLRQFIQLISWSSENDNVLRNLLEYLTDLIQDNDGNPIREYITRLNKENAVDIIMSISSSEKSSETLEMIDLLVSTFLSEETLE